MSSSLNSRDATHPKVGEKARDFRLPEASGELVTLSEEWKKGGVVLLFYPTDWGMVCSIEMKTFQSMVDDLQRRGTRIIAVSTSSVSSHRAWKEQMGITFKLLSDEEGQVSKLYGVVVTDDSILRGRSNRAAFFIDSNGTIRYSWVAQNIHFQPDYEELMRAIGEERPLAVGKR